MNCNNVTSGSPCVCPACKRALGGGAFCTGNNWHVNTACFPNSASFAAWCKDSSGTNQLVNVNVICARVL